MVKIFDIAGPGLSASVSEQGAELVALRDAAGRDLLWNGDPAFWPGRAPVLFPIVGQVAGDRYRLGGESFPLGRHGFARRRTFSLVEARADAVVLRLEDDAETRAVYPFAFVLDLRYAIGPDGLRVTATVAARDERPLPVSLGFHPGFVWPLPYGKPRAEHRIVFAEPEPAPIRRLADGLLMAEEFASPVVGDTLALRDAIFVDDAIIFDRLRSRRVRYGAPGAPEIEVRFPLMPHLGVWSKPGAPFVCIEPWQGHADPVGYAGDFTDRPGSVTIAPGTAREFGLEIALVAA